MDIFLGNVLSLRHTVNLGAMVCLPNGAIIEVVPLITARELNTSWSYLRLFDEF